MFIQVFSDLHLESETFDPQPSPQAEVLVLAGDIDTTWRSWPRFANWPAPVLVVAGNQEFDGRDLVRDLPRLREACETQGLRLLHREEHVLIDAQGRRVRFLGTPLWSDFGVLGESGRAKAERAAGYYLRHMGATREGLPLDVAQMKAEGQMCTDWLSQALSNPSAVATVDATVVVTHFAPSLRSADPRYGRQPGTASFCNATDAWIPWADLWIHGHVHCRHDYGVERPPGHPLYGRPATRVVSQARGLAKKNEEIGFDSQRCFEV